MYRLSWAVLLLLCGTAGQALTLAENGRPRATIVVAPEATPAERTAAAELATYLRKITGAEFSTGAGGGGARLLVGPSPEARRLLGAAAVDALGPEEFVLRTIGNDLLLVGGRPRGTLYAVYSFLDHDLGCRWLNWYGEESVPRRPALVVPALDRREKPAMAVRDIVTHPNGNADRQLLQQFLVRNRCQGPDLRFTGDLAACGETSHRFVFPPKGWLVHTLFQWVPPEEHFKDHPDWFSLAGDKRVSNRQLCFTNRGLRDALTAAVLKRIAEAGPGGLYSVSAMDWTGPFCDCPQCRALVEREGTPGAPLLDYLAELGAKVKAVDPTAWVSTLAYRKEQSEAPPRTIKLPGNVLIIFAPIDDNFAAPIEHPSNASTLENLRNWPRATSHLWVWYYPNTYGPALPLGNLHRLAQDCRLFKQVGVEGYYMEHDAPGIYDSRRLSDLQSWLITRLMWNPEQDLDGLIADFTDHYYGSAAPLLRRYLSGLEAATAAMATPLSWNASTGQHQCLTADLLLSSQGLFDQAEQAVGADATLLARVRQARMSLDLACLLLWDRLSAAGPPPFTRQQLVARYRETYTAAVNARAVEGRRSALLRDLEASLRWQGVMTELKPLPPPLNAVPAARVRQFTPDTARLYGKTPPVVAEDPLAAAGLAVSMEPDLTPPPYAPRDLPSPLINFGFYDAVSKRQQHAYAGREVPLKPGEYRLYPVGRTALSPDCLVWFDWSWHIQFPDVAALYDPQNPGKQWEVYVSVRVSGPAFDAQSAEQHSRFYVDRIVFVAAE